MNKNTTYQIIINNQPLVLTLTPSPLWGYCVTCLKKTTIKVIAKHPNQLRRKFCSDCALNQVDNLWDFKFENRAQTIIELRRFLLTEEKTEILECYG